MRASVWVSRLRTTIFCKPVRPISSTICWHVLGGLLLHLLLAEDSPAIERLDMSWSSHLCYQAGRGAPDFEIIDLIVPPHVGMIELTLQVLSLWPPFFAFSLRFLVNMIS